MLAGLSMISDFIFSSLSQIWNLYAAGTVLTFAVVLYILDYLFDIFDVLRR